MPRGQLINQLEQLSPVEGAVEDAAGAVDGEHGAEQPPAVHLAPVHDAQLQEGLAALGQVRHYPPHLGVKVRVLKRRVFKKTVSKYML